MWIWFPSVQSWMIPFRDILSLFALLARCQTSVPCVIRLSYSVRVLFRLPRLLSSSSFSPFPLLFLPHPTTSNQPNVVIATRTRTLPDPSFFSSFYFPPVSWISFYCKPKIFCCFVFVFFLCLFFFTWNFSSRFPILSMKGIESLIKNVLSSMWKLSNK